MSLIKNLITEKTPPPKKEEEGQKPRPIIKSATDLQRLKLEKLMKNPEKPIMIPEPRKEKDYMQSVPSFVRNVMGSSAGAGSGEFHVYRHLRRKEYARQKTIQAKSTREQMDDDYQRKIEGNQRAAEDKTAKKRAKRLKKKQRAAKRPKANQSKEQTGAEKNESEESEDEEDKRSHVDAQTVEKEEMDSQEHIKDNKEEKTVNMCDDDHKKIQNSLEAMETESKSTEEIIGGAQESTESENGHEDTQKVTDSK